jgi:Bax protein
MEKNLLSPGGLKYFFIFVFSALLLLNACRLPEQKRLAGHVLVIDKRIQTPADIVTIKGPDVIPYFYSHPCSLDTLPVTERKQKFFDMMLPAILVAKTNLDLTRQEVEKLVRKNRLTRTEKKTLKMLMKAYRTGKLPELIKRLHTFPVSIVLAQAAIESGWGTSRFFIQANNPFGMWSFNPDHHRIAAASTRDGTKVYLRKFGDIEQAIDAYYKMLAVGKPFAAFRDARMHESNPDSLIQYLKMYSERRDLYVQDLAEVIRTNHLKKFDHYRIAPEYIRKKRSFHLFDEW